MAKQKKSLKGKRIALSVLCVLLGIVLVVMAGATVLADSILGNMNYVDKAQTESLSLEEAEALKEQMTEAVEEDEEFDGPVLSEDELDLDVVITEPIGEQKHITNILLIGQDTLKGQRERSDTMMLITVNTEKNTITVTSFMRDMYVKIPGYFKEKINAAYMLGGMETLNQTLYENFGIVVDGNVEVSFTQFTNIIDYLGGIDLELDAKEAAFVNKAVGGGAAATMKEGMNHLNGDRALAYARYRDKTRGDFDRTLRQRKTLDALIKQYKNSDLTTMIGMVNELMGMITTDMTKTEILNYAVRFFPMLTSAEFISQRVPFDGKHTNGKDYYYMAKINEISVIVPNLEANAAKLAETLN